MTDEAAGFDPALPTLANAAMTCDDRRDSLLLYAAGALDPDEVADVRQHLVAGCVACVGALAEARATFAAVSFAADPVQPSAAVRQRLIDRISTVDEPAIDAGHRSPWRLLAPFLSAAAAVSITLGVLRYERDRPVAVNAAVEDQRASLLQSAVHDRDRTLSELRDQLARQQQIVDALRSPKSRLVTLGPQRQPHAAAQLVWNPTGRRAVLLASGLSAPVAGKTYELWFVTTDGRKVRAATFNPAADGTASVSTVIPASVVTLAAAAVTDEPAGGTDSPTGQFQLLGKAE